MHFQLDLGGVNGTIINDTGKAQITSPVSCLFTGSSSGLTLSVRFFITGL